MGAQDKLMKTTDMQKKGRGTSSVVSTADNITVTHCLDQSVIHIASTWAGKYPEDLANICSKKESEVFYNNTTAI